MLISIFCESHTMANFVSTGAFYPMIVLCGLLWPLEGMPQLLRNFALLLPFTIPTISVCVTIAFSTNSNFDCYNVSKTISVLNSAGAKHFNQRHVDHKSKCVQRFYCNISVDCGILLLMFGRTTKKEIKKQQNNNNKILLRCISLHSVNNKMKCLSFG